MISDQTRTAATIEEVAAVAGVSRSTVSRVVNGSTAVSPAALESVRRAIAELNYVPNRAARSLASRSTLAIALVVPEDTNRVFGDPFFASVVSGINSRISRSDYVLNLIMASADPGDKTAQYVRSGAVDGAIIVSHHTSDTFIERIAAAVPVVYGGRPVRSRGGDYYIDVDNVAGARDATAYLIGRGCRHIGAITGPPSMPAGVDRAEGYRVALAESGLTPAPVVQGDFTTESGAAAMRAILAAGEPLDGLFVASDLMARGAMQVLAAEGIRIPDEVAVMGFDDSPVALTTEPQLTTMRQPSFTQGECMADVLLARLAGMSPPEVTILDTELIVRGSA